MRYILQVNTGSFQRCAATPEHVVAHVERCLDRLDVSDVIFGWTNRREVHDALSDLLLRRNIRQHLWLPIFAEIDHAKSAAPFMMAEGHGSGALHLCEGEHFEFVCPSAPENLSGAFAAFESLAIGLPLDGVFVDRIRYPSTANDPAALWGCGCAHCRAIYEEAGALLSAGDLLPVALEHCRYHFANPRAEALFAAKRTTINRAVAGICDHFHQKGLAVGLDSFAPSVSDFVGQDVVALAGMVDFIKPMMYRRTTAPAGIPFEMDALATALGARFDETLAQLWGGDVLSDEINQRQMAALQSVGGNTYPGIETNRIDGICTSTPDYVRESIAQADAAGCQRVVLSWDALHMPDDILDLLSQRKSRSANEIAPRLSVI